jgi:putative oxidoreductase
MFWRLRRPWQPVLHCTVKAGLYFRLIRCDVIVLAPVPKQRGAGKGATCRADATVVVSRRRSRARTAIQGGTFMAMQDTSPSAFSATDRLAAGSTNALLLIGRIMFGFIFLQAGYYKLMNIAGTTGYLTSLKVPAAGLFAWLVGILELVMGAALILGIATRYAAIAVFIFVLIATALAHRYWEFPAAQVQGQWNNFVKNIALMGGALALFVTGAGGASVDARMKK